MQAQLDAEHPELEIDIVIVNEDGYDSGLPDLELVTDLPIVQDDAVADVWGSWGVTWRDTWVLDADNVEVEIFNLTDYGLEEEINYHALYTIFVEAAGG